MLALLIVIGIIWIVLKILTLIIELPFRILGALFSLPFSIFFWIIVMGLIFYTMSGAM